MSEFLYIAVESDILPDDAEILEYAGVGKTAEEAIENVYCEDENGNHNPDAIIDIYKYEGSFVKRVETTIQKVNPKGKKGKA